jgi:hypothetical protein
MEVSIVRHANGQSLVDRRLKTLVDLGAVDPDPKSRHDLEPELARRKEPVKGVHPRIGPAAFDPGDRLLGDPGLLGELSLRQPRASTGFAQHPAGHRHVRLLMMFSSSD